MVSDPELARNFSLGLVVCRHLTARSIVLCCLLAPRCGCWSGSQGSDRTHFIGLRLHKFYSEIVLVGNPDFMVLYGPLCDSGQLIRGAQTRQHRLGSRLEGQQTAAQPTAIPPVRQPDRAAGRPTDQQTFRPPDRPAPACPTARLSDRPTVRPPDRRWARMYRQGCVAECGSGRRHPG